MTIQEMRSIKQEFGLSNREISLRTGLPVNTLQRIFSGKTKSPRMETLIALENVLRTVKEGSWTLHPTPILKEAARIPYSVDPPKRYTVEDYYALPDERRVELIDGVFYDMAAPSVTHQTILGELYLQFRKCMDSHEGKCKVFLSPCDVQLDQDDKTMLQPDLLVVCEKESSEDENGGKDIRLGNDRCIFGAPDQVVEILSPSTRSKDTILKFTKYSNADVREYWIVDPANEAVFIYDFENPGFRPDIYSFDDDQIPIHISKGKCHVNFAEIHRRLG